MSKLVYITVKNNDGQDEIIRNEEITYESYQLATNRDAVKFFKSIGSKETRTPYGLKSESPDGLETSYIGILANMPKYVQAFHKQAYRFE